MLFRSVLRTADPEETADLLEVVARREQEADDREVSVHGEKGGKTLTERQEYVISSVAEVGPVTARALLEHFGSVEGEIEAEIAQQAGLAEFEDAEATSDDGNTDEAGDGEAAGGEGVVQNDDGTASGADAEPDGQAGLADFAGGAADRSDADDPEGTVAEADPDGETVEVVADQRELDSHIARDLSTREGVETRLETLAVGDYVLSDRVVVERKSVEIGRAHV